MQQAFPRKERRREDLKSRSRWSRKKNPPSRARRPIGWNKKRGSWERLPNNGTRRQGRPWWPRRR
eukprot:15293463-Heterocapsa_arctica.AAC.1